MHDAHLVALSLEHGVHEILTLDDDFRRFPQVSSRNPFRRANGRLSRAPSRYLRSMWPNYDVTAVWFKK